MAKRKDYPGSIDRRGDSFRVQLCVGGRRDCFSVQTTDERVAKQRARQREAELKAEHARRQAGLPVAVRMSDLLAEFDAGLAGRVNGTQRSYRDSLTPFREFFVDELGDLRVDGVTARHIDSYLQWRRNYRKLGNHKTARGPLAARTLNKDRTVLHAVFDLAERYDYCASNPVRKTKTLKGDGREPIILDSEQYERLLTECGHNSTLALYVLLLGETGLRCESEALHLRWTDIDLDSGFISVVSGRDGHRTKGGRSREVPITARLDAALRQARQSAESRYLFARDGQRLGTMRRSFKSAAARAKLPAGLHQHDLRHRRVTDWMGDGKSPALVQRAVGHARIDTTMLYSHFRNERLRALVEPAPKLLTSGLFSEAPATLPA
jgi:integrase